MAAFARNDLAVSGAHRCQGDRKKNGPPADEIDTFVHCGKPRRRHRGRGIKVSQSGAWIPRTLGFQAAPKEGREIRPGLCRQNIVPGLSYICQTTPFREREMFGNEECEWGTRLRQRETSTMVFDNVFIPWRGLLCA